MKYILVVFILFFSVSAFSERQAGKITGYTPYSSDGKEILVFKVENNVFGGCNTTARFAIDNTSPRYRNTLAAILAAYHGNSPVTVNYLNTCNAWGNSADVDYICVGNINC